MLPEGPACKQHTAGEETPFMPFGWRSPEKKLLIDHLTTCSVVSLAMNGVQKHVLRPEHTAT